MARGAVILGLVLLTAALYAPTRTHGVVYEDAQALQTADTRPVLALRPSRALTEWTYHLTWGVVGHEPGVYHLGNVAIHLTNGVLVYAVTAALLPGSVAIWGAGVFLLHPLNSAAVNALSARTDLLMTTGVLLALWAGLGTLTILRTIGIGIGLLVAGTSKEIGLIAVPLVALTWWQWRRRAPQTVALCAGLGIGLGAWLGYLWPTLVQWATLDPATGGSSLAWGEFLLLQVGAVWHLLALVLPSSLWIDGFSIDHDALALSPLALAVSLLLTGVVVAGIAWSWHRSPLLAWGLAWGAVSVAPRFVFRTSEFVTEPQMYLSMVGISVLLGACAHALWTWTPHPLSERTA